MFNRAFIALPLSLMVASPAFAGIAKSVAIEDALDGRVPIVVAVEGGGVNIDFSETGETVQKVTLDDTSKVLVDFDKSLPIVRLFRSNVTNKDIPNAKTTQLSVTTKGADGDFHLYIFPVTTSSKPAVFTKFLIGGVTRKRGSNTIATAALGAKVAQQNQTLVDPQLKARVAHYVQMRDRGMSDRKAAKRAKISIALAKRLDELGQSAPASVAALPTPRAAEAPSPLPRSTPEVQPKPDTKHKHKARVFEDELMSQQEALLKSTLVVPSGAQGADPNTQTPIAQVPAVIPTQPKSVAPVQRLKEPTTTIAKTTAINQSAYANALLRGLVKARINGKIRYGSNQWYAVNSAVRTLRLGGSLDRAIVASGMKRDGFMKLLSDGGMAV